jgi:hypothetical protein
MVYAVAKKDLMVFRPSGRSANSEKGFDLVPTVLHTPHDNPGRIGPEAEFRSFRKFRKSGDATSCAAGKAIDQVPEAPAADLTGSSAK